MLDPYQILGIRRDASDAEIKKAYRNLSRKYHPDANLNNPNKEQAEEKFKEVQTAYEQIMREKEQGYGYQSSGGYGDFGFGGFYQNQSSNNGANNGHLQAAMNYIRNGHFDEAIHVLNEMEHRDAQWYYYAALAYSAKGSNAMAMEYARTACEQEPQNYSYQRLYQQLQSGQNWYEQQGQMYGMPVASGGWCFKLCLLNLFCNLCCGI